MKTLLPKAKIIGVMLMKFFIMLVLLVGFHHASAQGTRFFRISGPAQTVIISFNPDGSLVWSNALTGINYTVQTATTLSGGTNWVDYVRLPTTNAVHTNRLIAFQPPAGMTLIPAGVFTMGNSSDSGGESPTNIYVSAFFMETNLVSYGQWQAVYAYASGHGYSFAGPGAGKATNHPVQMVTWFDCVKWCNARSEQAGLTPVYYDYWSRVYKTGQVTNPYVQSLSSGHNILKTNWL